MPHLAFHMSVARDLAGRLGNRIVDADRGAYYIGSTGPDMHILSRADRISSHYFDLDCLDDQSSVALFFEAHADLREVDRVDGPTVAFVAGYLTHLVVDEVWITDIYRPFFGPDSLLGGDPRANVLDRVIQYDLDLQRRMDREAMDEIREALDASPLEVRVDFIQPDMLIRWRELAVDIVSRPPSWDRFTRTASRFLNMAGVSTDEQIEEFMNTLPQVLEETKSHVGRERIEGFAGKAGDLALRALEEYLR